MFDVSDNVKDVIEFQSIKDLKKWTISQLGHIITDFQNLLYSFPYFCTRLSENIWDKNNEKEHVIFLLNKTIPPSETFILDEIKNFKKYSHLVLTLNLVSAKLLDRVIRLNFNQHKKLKRILKNNKALIYHAQFGTDALMFLKIKRIYNLPLIVSFRGYDLYKKINECGYCYAPLFKTGDLFLARSKSMKRDLIKLGCPSYKVFVHYTGIDLNKFKFKKRNPKKIIRFLSVCRFTEKKGLPYLLEAFSKLKKEYDNIELVILGKRIEYESLILGRNLKKYIKKSKLTDYVTIKRWVDYDKIQDEYHGSDIFVLPSITSHDGDKEGIPNSLKEAMATGMPVISTYHSGIPELIENGKNGFLVREKDADELYDKMKFLVKNPLMWGRVGLSARKKIENEFNLEEQNKKLERIYSNLKRYKVVLFSNLSCIESASLYVLNMVKYLSKFFDFSIILLKKDVNPVYQDILKNNNLTLIQLDEVEKCTESIEKSDIVYVIGTASLARHFDKIPKAIFNTLKENNKNNRILFINYPYSKKLLDLLSKDLSSYFDILSFTSKHYCKKDNKTFDPESKMKHVVLYYPIFECQKIGKNAQRYMTNNFNIDKFSLEHLNSFIDIIESKTKNIRQNWILYKNYLTYFKNKQKKRKDKHTIAYIVPNFTKPNESWIFNEIKFIDKFRKIVITHSIKNFDKIFKNKITTFVVPKGGSESEIEKIFLNEKIDLIHCQFGFDGKKFLPISKKLGIPLIASFKGYDAYGLPLRKGFNYYDDLFKSEAKVIVPSKHMALELNKLGCSFDKVIYHTFGCDIRKFKFVNREKKKKIRFLFTGRLIGLKGLEYSLKAFKKLKEECSNIEFRIVGDGEMRNYLVKLRDKLKLKDSVEFILDIVPHEKVFCEMSKAHIFLHPSVVDEKGRIEGVPNSVIEAMATGMPVISTYNGGIPELIKDGINGFLVKEKDIEGLYIKMKYLIENPNIWKKIGLRARKTVLKKHNIFKQKIKLEKIYQHILNQNL